MEILYLTLDMFRQKGGIQKANLLLSLALAERIKSYKTENVPLNIFSLHDRTATADVPSELAKFYRPFEGKRLRFILSSFRMAMKSRVMIINHINLLPILLAIRVFKPSLRVILIAHGIEVWGKISVWKKLLIGNRTEIWAASRFTADSLTNALESNKNIVVLNHAILPDFNAPSSFFKPDKLIKRYGLNNKYPIILSLCRMSDSEHNKGYDNILNAMPELKAEFPDIHYMLVGQSDEIEYQRLARKTMLLGLQQHTTIVGLIDELELPDHYLLADIFVLPSKKEGFGLTFIEAAACGRKIIAGNIDGSRDALMDGQLGLLIDPEDPKALKDAIINSVKTKPSFEDAAAIQDLCLKNFSFKQYKDNVSFLLTYKNEQ